MRSYVTMLTYDAYLDFNNNAGCHVRLVCMHLQIDSLLSVLDKTIVMRRQYEEEKERYIL